MKKFYKMRRYSVVDVLKEAAEEEISIISILKEILLPDLADHLN